MKTTTERDRAVKATVSTLPIHSSDGYSYGGGHIVNCPIVYRDGSGPKELSMNYVALSLGVALGPRNGSGDALTARFIADAINEKIEREFK